MKLSSNDLKYLKLLANTYRNIDEVSAEIINLTAIQNLPKGTEHFLSDIHGESDAFTHILRNASGTIRMKIDESFPELSLEKRRRLATIVYYPEEKLELINASITFKYTRSYTRKLIPKNFVYIIEELLSSENGKDYRTSDHRKSIIKSVIEIDNSDALITALANTISAASVFRLHILGDIFDRGPGADVVFDVLEKYHSVDITWGNHDILWMGAAAGNKACIANVIRICTRYDNLHTLEVGYGISLRPLITFALNTYATDSCPNFKAKVSNDDAMRETDLESLSKISKAIAIIQFKLEGQLIDKHPYYEMDSMKLLDKIDYENYTVEVNGKKYPMNNTFFPTIDPKNPYKLTAEEDAVMNRLQKAFLESAPLQKDIEYLYSHGSLYKTYNGNLLFHGCMPLTENGEFDYINTSDGPMRGKAWFDYAEKLVRTGYFAKGGRDKQRGIDICWYLWCGYKSPLFGKARMTTFERLFIEDEETHKEPKNPYYSQIAEVKTVEKILKEFGCNVKQGTIINGHMPVKKGTNPIKAKGRALCIDGGLAKAYQKTTGIAGYSLIQNSYGFILSAHEPFESKEKAVRDELDIFSSQVAKKNISKRILNKDTDEGKERQVTIELLKRLLECYKSGEIKQSGR
ncbi:MAG: fructose-1,6-bisphosphatase [Clostridia bacterium]|nr:fructose-1,6-bisphosphatase [Clostridia bacterium]